MITEQYRPIAGNLLIWVLGHESNPLRQILGSHLRELSHKKWGVSDLAWVVSKGGGSKMQSSAVWRNICSVWSHLKPLLRPSAPRNAEEWGHQPI